MVSWHSWAIPISMEFTAGASGWMSVWRGGGEGWGVGGGGGAPRRAERSAGHSHRICLEEISYRVAVPLVDAANNVWLGLIGLAVNGTEPQVDSH